MQFNSCSIAYWSIWNEVDFSLNHSKSFAFQNEVNCVKSKWPKCSVVNIIRPRLLLKVAMLLASVITNVKILSLMYKIHFYTLLLMCQDLIRHLHVFAYSYTFHFLRLVIPAEPPKLYDPLMYLNKKTEAILVRFF